MNGPLKVHGDDSSNTSVFHIGDRSACLFPVVLSNATLSFSIVPSSEEFLLAQSNGKCYKICITSVASQFLRAHTNRPTNRTGLGITYCHSIEYLQLGYIYSFISRERKRDDGCFWWILLLRTQTYWQLGAAHAVAVPWKCARSIYYAFLPFGAAATGQDRRQEPKTRNFAIKYLLPSGCLPLQVSFGSDMVWCEGGKSATSVTPEATLGDPFLEPGCSPNGRKYAD